MWGRESGKMSVLGKLPHICINATYDEPVKGVPCEDHFDGVGIWLLVATTATRLKGILLFFLYHIFVESL